MDDLTPQRLSTIVHVKHRYSGTIITPTSDEFNAMHWNIRSLVKKTAELELCIQSFPSTLHVIAVSETWLSTDILSAFNLLGYVVFHCVRTENKCGGVALFIHESICGTSPIVKVNVVTPDLNHFLVVNIPSVNLSVAVPYRRPRCNENIFLEELETHCLNEPNCLVMGDLNMDLLTASLFEKLVGQFEAHGYGVLNAVNNLAVTRKVSNTILDIAATNMAHLRYKLSIIHNAKSDHAILYLSFNRKVRSSSISRSRVKLNLNEATMKVNQLCSSNTIANGDELNIAIECIVSNCSKQVTLKSNARPLKPHANSDLVMEIRNRDRLFHLTNFCPHNNYIVSQYEQSKEKVEKLNLQLRTDYELQRFEDAAGNARKTWILYKEILQNKRQSQSEETITVNGILLDNSVNSCNIINNQFCSAGENLATEIIALHGYDLTDIDALYPEHATNDWSFQHVSSEDVSSAINSLPNKKTTGIDMIPIQLLKATILLIAPLIAMCINLAIDTTIFPIELLKGRLKLIKKSGDSNIDNFRGLTILPVISKIFELLLMNQLVAYLDGINFFKGNQFGFLRHSNCESAALQLVNWIKAHFKKQFVACVYVDLKRAFDTVEPKRLARKLKRLGLSVKAVKVMLSYLQGRSTATTLGNNKSDFCKVNVGVAQGSKIGPLHFLIYINDMLDLNLYGKLILYADDAVLAYACDDWIELQLIMQHDADVLNDWLCRNVLTLNVDKTKYMTFGKSNSMPDMFVQFGGKSIERVRKFKYLGLVLDEELSFHDHIDHVKRQLVPFIPTMWRSGRFIPLSKRKEIYFAYVQSHLQYMISIYSECVAYKLKELYVLQKRCIKALFRLPKLTPSTYLFSSRLLPLSELVIVERVMLIHKMKQHRIKHNFTFSSNQDVHGRATRNGMDIHLFNPWSKRNVADENVSTALLNAVNDFNFFNKQLSGINSIKTYKDKLKILVLQRQGKSVISPYFFNN